MTLNDYLAEHNETPAAFARRAEINRFTLYDILNGRRKPGPRVLPLIVAATEGAVAPNDFYALSALPKTASAARYRIDKPMTLKDWIDQKSDLTVQAAATELGVELSALYRYMRGERIPREEHMKAIYRLTGGAVTPNDFYALPALPKTASAGGGVAAEVA